MKKSQIAIEFIFAFGIIFFIFLIILGFSFARSKDIIDSSDELGKRNTCLMISSLFTSAFAAGEGTVINYSMDYNATINFTNVNSSYKNINVEGTYCLLPLSNIPAANLQKGAVEIENRGSYVNIKNT